MRRFFLLFIVLATVCYAHADDAKKVKYSKTQQVNFEDTDIDGKVNSPDGAYLLQKRGVQFLPLYKVNNQFEKNILESVEYLR
jgi:hypothetical protein